MPSRSSMASNSRRVTARRNSLLLRLNGSEFPLVAFRRSARGKTDNQGCPVSVGGAPQGYSLPPPSLSTMKSPSRVVRSKTVFQGCLIRVDVDRVREPGGVEADREIIRHSGSVVLLPVFPGGKVLLVRQFRYAAQRALWELPAGRREPGDDDSPGGPQGAGRRDRISTGPPEAPPEFLCQSGFPG